MKANVLILLFGTILPFALVKAKRLHSQALPQSLYFHPMFDKLKFRFS